MLMNENLDGERCLEKVWRVVKNPDSVGVKYAFSKICEIFLVWALSGCRKITPFDENHPLPIIDRHYHYPF